MFDIEKNFYLAFFKGKKKEIIKWDLPIYRRKCIKIAHYVKILKFICCILVKNPILSNFTMKVH